MKQSFFQRHTLPTYRITQFNTAFYQQFIGSIDDLSVWPKPLRTLFSEEVPWTTLQPIKTSISQTKDTEKAVFQLIGGHTIETVLMRHGDGRNTVCVSSQSGCPVGCAFCATGKLGFKRNLTSEEIIDQILYYARTLRQQNESVTNIVFMGMGEPMLNMVEVQKALTTITDPAYMGISDRRITVSSSGFVPQLRQFIDSGYKGKLAISLHAPNQKIREMVMPIARKYPYNDVISIGDYYTQKTKRRMSYEYILIQNVNDQPAHAQELANTLRGKLIHVNLIPCNPVPGTPFQKPDWKTMQQFSQTLTRQRIANTLRVTMGDSIKAACGQLSGGHS